MSRNVIVGNGPSGCNNTGIVGSGVFCWVRPEVQSRVVSPQLAFGRQSRWRSSQKVALVGGMVGGGAHIFISRCLAAPDLVVR
jgi:hypothetical protein